MTNPGFDKARIFICRRFTDLKNKIISNFKEGYIKKDLIIVNVPLYKCRIFCLFVNNTNCLMKFRIFITTRRSNSHKN